MDFPSREFDEVVAGVCHGLLSEEQAHDLNELLRQNARARDEYILRLELHSRLASQLDLYASAGSGEVPAGTGGGFSFPLSDPDRGPRKVGTRRRIVWVVGLAASVMLVAVSGVMFWHFAQPPSDGGAQPMVAAANSEWTPSSANLPGHEYPRINGEERAQFRIEAPDAKDVTVNIGHPLMVTRSDDGVWTVTTAPLAIGFHFYELVIDGERVPDPGTPVFRGGGGDGFSSGIEVPTGEDFYERKSVPHGVVSEHQYFSQTTEDWRRIFVYTPPDYERDTTQRFSVLYLLPGAGEDESCWSAQGRVAEILDNLIAEGKARPMLAVMEGGIAHKPGEPDTTWRAPADLSQRFITLDEVFVTDLLPMIDETHRTIADGEHRAIAGLSLGGAQAFAIGLRHPDVFAHIGGFSGIGGGPGRNFNPNTVYGAVMADVDTFNEMMRVLFISIGADDPEWIANSVKSFRDSLQAMGINHVFYESADTGHEWHTWRRSLREFAPLLFQERSGDR